MKSYSSAHDSMTSLCPQLSPDWLRRKELLVTAKLFVQPPASAAEEVLDDLERVRGAAVGEHVEMLDPGVSGHFHVTPFDV